MLKFWDPRALKFLNYGALRAPKWGGPLFSHDTRFRIGFDYDHHCVKARNNMHSVREHPEIIREYLAKECAEGRILGPFPPASLPYWANAIIDVPSLRG